MFYVAEIPVNYLISSHLTGWHCLPITAHSSLVEMNWAANSVFVFHVTVTLLYKLWLWTNDWLKFTCRSLNHSAGLTLTATSYREHRHIVVLSTGQISDGAGSATAVTVVSCPSVAHCLHMKVLGIRVGGPGHDHGPISTLSFNSHTLGWTGC